MAETQTAYSQLSKEAKEKLRMQNPRRTGESVGHYKARLELLAEEMTAKH